MNTVDVVARRRLNRSTTDRATGTRAATATTRTSSVATAAPTITTVITVLEMMSTPATAPRFSSPVSADRANSAIVAISVAAPPMRNNVRTWSPYPASTTNAPSGIQANV